MLATWVVGMGEKLLRALKTQLRTGGKKLPLEFTRCGPFGKHQESSLYRTCRYSVWSRPREHHAHFTKKRLFEITSYISSMPTYFQALLVVRRACFTLRQSSTMCRSMNTLELNTSDEDNRSRHRHRTPTQRKLGSQCRSSRLPGQAGTLSSEAKSVQ